MSGRTHGLAEWLSMLSLGVGLWASWAALMWLLADAHRTDFDPRPWLARAIESGRLDPLLVAVANGKHDARELAAGVVLDTRLSLRHAALTSAALLALLAIRPEAIR